MSSLELQPIDRTAQLSRIANWVKDHGFHAFINGGAVMIEMPFSDGHTEIEQAEDFSEAREILGY